MSRRKKALLICLASVVGAVLAVAAAMLVPVIWPPETHVTYKFTIVDSK